MANELYYTVDRRKTGDVIVSMLSQTNDRMNQYQQNLSCYTNAIVLLSRRNVMNNQQLAMYSSRV